MRHARSVLALFLFIFLAVGLSTAHSFTVSGRAYGIYVNAPSLGVVDQTYCDTGNLPPTGGNLGESVPSFELAGIATTGSMGVSSYGDDCEGDSDVVYPSGGIILPGHAAEITFSSMWGNDDDECCNPDDDDDDHFIIEGLTFGGVPINVTGAYDQTHTIAGVGELVVNSRLREGDGDDGCDDDDFKINGLHLTLDNGDEIIVGSMYFDSKDDCCAVPTDHKTWGAIKNLFGVLNG